MILIALIGVLIFLIGSLFNVDGWFEPCVATLLLDISLNLYRIKDKMNVTK